MFEQNYDSYDGSEMILGEKRFPFGAIGVEEWQKLVDQVFNDQESEIITKRNSNPIRKLSRPRVFISHQRKDHLLARRIAYLATRREFTYWLDVTDPQLKNLHGKRLSRKQKNILLAQIIETALLNSTHVIGILSNHAKKSRWLPYEYGRVKQRTLSTTLAMTWIHPSYVGYLPEYLILGSQTNDEQSIDHWFSDQLRWFLKAKKQTSLPPRKSKAWKYRIPPQLPR